MNILKKLVPMLTAFALVMLCVMTFSAVSSAASADQNLTIAAEAGNPNVANDNTVKVSVMIAENAGCLGVNFDIKWDTKLLEVVSIENGTDFTTMKANHQKQFNRIVVTVGEPDLAIMNPAWAVEVTGTGKVLDITFKAKTDATGTAKVYFERASYLLMDGTVCETMNTVSATLNILDASHTHTPGASATCTTSQICTVCKAELAPALGHTGQNSACDLCVQLAGGYAKLTEDSAVKLNLTRDLYVDLNGYDLTGTITTNGFKVYGMDSATNTYSAENAGAFRCVDENGQSIVPQRTVKTTVEMTGAIRRYLTVATENGYSFHRFYLSVTHTSLGTADTSVGYKAVFYGDDLVKSQLDTFGYSLQLNGNDAVSRDKTASEFLSGDVLTLRIKNYDVENHGETELHAHVNMKLTDGTVIESSTKTVTLRQLVESVNGSYAQYDAAQLEALKKMIEANPVMKQWQVGNIWNYADLLTSENPDGNPYL